MSTPKIQILNLGSKYYPRTEADTIFATKEAVEKKADKAYVEGQIDNIEYMLSQFGVIGESTVEAVTHEVVVPIKSAKCAYLNMLGGKSYKSENLLNPKDFRDYNYGFLTVVNNGDGTLTLNGTGNSEELGWTSDIMGAQYDCTDGTYYVSVEGMPENLALLCYTGNADYSGESFNYIYSDGYTAISGTYINGMQFAGYSEGIGEGLTGGTITAENAVVKIWITKDEPKPYSPYFEGLRDTKVTALRNNGANLIPFPYTDGMSKTVNGITFTVNADGSIHAKGTATAQALFGLARNMGDLHTDSVWASGGKTVTASGRTYHDCDFFYRDKSIIMTVASGKTVDTTYYPMINYGATAAPYKPFREPITTVIPEAIQAIDGYGKGVDGTYYNYIDLERKVYVKNVERYIVTGDETLNISTTVNGVEMAYAEYGIYNASFNAKTDNATINLISSYYTPGTRYQVYDRLKPNFICITGKNLRWTDEIMTADEMKAKLKANPLVVDYILAEPIETDISGMMGEFTPLIKVEGGGTIVLENEHSNAVPVSVDFQIINQQGG